MGFIQYTSSISEFCKNSTVHGLKELSDDVSVIIKIIWSMFIAGCIAGLCIATVKTVNDYRRTIATVEKLDQNVMQVPEIVLCPAVFSNDEILTKIQFDEDLVDGLLMQMAYFTFYHSTAQEYFHSKRDDFGNLKNELAVFMKQNNVTSFDPVLRSLLPKPAATFSKQTSSYFDATIILKGMGPCYDLKYRKNRRTLPLLYGQVVIEIESTTKTSSFPAILENVLLMFIGKSSKTMLPYNPVRIYPGQFIDVEVEEQFLHYLSTYKSKCKGNIEDQHQCLLDCYGEIFCNCNIYVPDRTLNKSIPFCSQMDRDTMNQQGCVSANETDVVSEKRCFQFCPLACNRDIIRKSISYRQPLIPTNDSMVAPIKIGISLVDPTSWIVIQEMYALTPWDLFGTLGGQISLWCGASILSICQVMYYCVFKRFHISD